MWNELKHNQVLQVFSPMECQRARVGHVTSLPGGRNETRATARYYLYILLPIYTVPSSHGSVKPWHIWRLARLDPLLFTFEIENLILIFTLESPWNLLGVPLKSPCHPLTSLVTEMVHDNCWQLGQLATLHSPLIWQGMTMSGQGLSILFRKMQPDPLIVSMSCP